MYLCLIHIIIGIKYKQKDVFKNISTIVVFSLTTIIILQKQPVLMYNYTCIIMVIVQQLVLQKWLKFYSFKFSQLVWYLPLHVFEKKGGMGGVTPLP